MAKNICFNEYIQAIEGDDMKLTDTQIAMYAVEIYKSIFGLKKYAVIEFESPDFIVWQKDNEKIGIEVVRPSNQDQNELIKIANGEHIANPDKNLNIEKHVEEGRIQD